MVVASADGRFGVFQQADKGCLSPRDRWQGTQDVRRGFDDCLFHHAVAEVRKSDKVVTEENLASPRLESLKEHPSP